MADSAAGSEAGTAAAAQHWIRPPARWILPFPNSTIVTLLSEQLALSPLVAAVLAKRGFVLPAEAKAFLAPSLEALHNPLLMSDMDRAADRLWAAVANREVILLYGDYDVDGTSSVVILKKAIEILGGRADFHVPHRLKEGYGMRGEVVERAAQAGVRLIISVDTGIRSSEVVRQANDLGIDVIVTDHHLPEAELPPAFAVLNPNRADCQYPNKSLCGAGVTLKLVHALLAKSPLPAARQAALLDSFLKPVAIATVADVVPLIGENRTIVQRGLSGLRQVRNVGLRSLLSVAGFDEGEAPSAHQVAFRLAPRINAAGRMSTARDVIELFLTDDLPRAQEIAGQLDALNRERQETENEIIEAVLKQCEEKAFDLDSRAMVFSGEGWHLGVLGIVASRLAERFCRPVFVLSDAMAADDSGEAHLSGSGRSIPAFHLLEALESMPQLFSKFGGHKQAAGLTMRAVDLTAFRTALSKLANERLTVTDLTPVYEADAEASFDVLTEDCIRQVLSLGPFGCGNPGPVFYVGGAEVAGPPKVLREGKHFSVPLRHNGRMLFCKAWNFGDRQDLFKPGTKLDLLFQIEDDPNGRKRGYGSWCLSLKDIRPAGD